MSLLSALNIAQSGLQTAQTGLRTVSDNVANVNTVGYVRKVVDQQSDTVQGRGIGVSVSQIRTTADAYLEAASRQAGSDGGAASVTSDVLDQAQALFGDPNSATSFFGTLNDVFSSFISLASAPTTASRAQAAPATQALFDQASDVGSELAGLRSQDTSRIGADVETANGLLTQIDGLNSQISRAMATGEDASGAQDQQSQALEKLAALIPVQVSPRSGGGVVVRTGDGATLAGAGGAATLSYDGSGLVGQFTATSAQGVATTLAAPDGGEIGGLAKLRDTTLPALTAQLSELVGQTATTLNAVHNQYTAVPPPVSLTGRDTGLDPETALAHVSGQETLAVTGADGTVQKAVVIDFGAGSSPASGTLKDGAGNVIGSFTNAATLTSALNTALSGYASVDFTHQPATITSADTSASSSKRIVLVGGVYSAGDGTAANPPTVGGTAATKAGQGFSAYFGLNDLVSSTGLSSFATGLQAGDTAGFTAGAVSFRMTAADGSTLRDVTVAMPAGGGDMTTLLATLNAPSTGVGLYGAFALDSSGQLAFTANGSGAGLQVTADTTARNGTGPSFSALFGVGDAARSARLGQLSVRSDIQGDPSKLALATWKPGGQPPLSPTDASGADALAQAANATTSFGAAGGARAAQTSISTYAASFSAFTARAAASADDASKAADAVKTDADSRRASTEGVNIDQELVNLTTYQQAYSASARVIQAVKDMYDSLINMV